MRKVLLVTMLALFILGDSYAQERKITAESLPEKAKDFLSTYYAKIGIVSVKEEVASWFEKKEYEVKLTDGEEVEFDETGDWKKVDGNRKPIPLSLIPDNIVQYVRRSFPRTDIIKLKRNKRRYEVAISNGLELSFDKKGKFIKIDD